MAETSGLILQARALVALGMPELASSAWLQAAAGEEQVAPRLEMLDRNQEAAAHRLSAASCYEHAGELAKAINLYRAAQAGPLSEETRKETEQLLAACLTQFARSANGNATPRRPWLKLDAMMPRTLSLIENGPDALAPPLIENIPATLRSPESSLVPLFRLRFTPFWLRFVAWLPQRWIWLLRSSDRGKRANNNWSGNSPNETTKHYINQGTKKLIKDALAPAGAGDPNNASYRPPKNGSHAPSEATSNSSTTRISTHQ
jgi:hypothetical protein